MFPPVKPQFQPWDAHSNVKTENEAITAKTDLPSAALIKDLKSRGMLDQHDRAVERRVRAVARVAKRQGPRPQPQRLQPDRRRRRVSSAGHVHGATDDVGYKSVDGRVSVSDLHATILNQLGLDHNRLTFRHHGRDETLTDSPVTSARVVDEIIERPAAAT